MSNTDILKVTQYMKYYIDNYSIIENERINLFEELCFDIACVLQEWSGNTYVGIKKEKKEKYIFQNFFICLNDLINYLNTLDEEVMIIGGASIYKLFLPYAEVLYLTEIDSVADADVYFPEFDKKAFTKTFSEEHVDNDIKYKFVTYVRLK